MQYFTSKGFWALATLNVNRSRKCPLPKENDLKKTGRGASTINVNKEKFGCEILVRQQECSQCQILLEKTELENVQQVLNSLLQSSCITTTWVILTSLT